MVNGVRDYFMLYMILFGASILILALDPFVDFESALSGVATCFNNVGPGLGLFGPICNFSELTDFSKIILSIDMLLGRLELYPILILFVPSAWKK